MLLYYITDRKAFRGGDAEQRLALLRRIAEAARAGVDLIQLREKDLSARELECFAHQVVRAVRESSGTTKLLINGRADIALACDADGVHLPGGEIAASEARTLWTKCSDHPPTIGASAHSVEEVRYAESHGADFAVLAPIFKKTLNSAGGIGVDVLHTACDARDTPENVESCAPGKFAVLPLGGVTVNNAGACVTVGASGVAGIRLFQEGDVFETVRRLRSLAAV